MRKLNEGEISVICKIGVTKFNKNPINCPIGFSCLNIMVDRDFNEESCDDPFITTWTRYLKNKQYLIEVENE